MKTISVRPFAEEDKAALLPWFALRGWPDMELLLPPFGWVADDSAGAIAAIWMYVAPPLGMMEWAVTRPGAPARRALRGLEVCVEEAKRLADDMGLRAVLHLTANEKLAKYLDRESGFRPVKRETLAIWTREGINSWA